MLLPIMTSEVIDVFTTDGAVMLATRASAKVNAIVSKYSGQYIVQMGHGHLLGSRLGRRSALGGQAHAQFHDSLIALLV